ncbi:MAG: DUF4147 domain-containing protein [Labilithrix sp.]|nr:DUF4147 domain-containing protein [Labilithrix sp.]MCW5818053.1 DUF4147 domain-containing protein [Labilithrix sp.]
MSLDATKLESLLQAALAELHPTARVAGALAGLEPLEEVRLVAIGKAAPAMARGALMAWSQSIVETLVVTTDDTNAAGLQVFRAGHPLPDARSVTAADLCFGVAARAASLLVLVSGGASALVCAPAPGVTLKDKRAVTQALLESGAPIADINVVRKHLSRIKGGGLARAAGGVPVYTLAMSDVVKGGLHDVGSGPSVGDPSTVAQARRVVARWAPKYADLPFVKTGRTGANVGGDVVIAPADLARAMSSRLRQRDITVRVLRPSDAPLERLAKEYLRAAKTLAPGHALVRVAEPSLTVTGEGRGGRSTHLATLVGRQLPSGCIFAAFATDGVDGTSDTAGAVVDDTFVARAGEDAIVRALAAFDTGPLHLGLGTAVPTEPTGHNLADLHVLVRTHDGT